MSQFETIRKCLTELDIETHVIGEKIETQVGPKHTFHRQYLLFGKGEDVECDGVLSKELNYYVDSSISFHGLSLNFTDGKLEI